MKKTPGPVSNKKNSLSRYRDSNYKDRTVVSLIFVMGIARLVRQYHSGETDEANCSWLHPVWPPPKRPDQDNTFCVVNRTSTELIFCIHRDFDVRNKVCKPRRLVCQCCRDISAWKSRVMKPTVLGDEANFWGAFAWDEANWVWMKPTPHLRRA